MIELADFVHIFSSAHLDSRYLNTLSSLSDLFNIPVARGNLGLVAGGSGDIWVEKAGDTMTGVLTTLGVKRAIAIKVADYVATTTDEVIVCNKTTEIKITLPPATGSGQTYAIANVNTGVATLDGDSSDTINGDTTQTIDQWACIQVVDYITNKWIII